MATDNESRKRLQEKLKYYTLADEDVPGYQRKPETTSEEVQTPKSAHDPPPTPSPTHA